MTGDSRENVDNDVAIIGMSCRLPGAPTIDQYWSNLCHGVESITQFSADELDRSVPKDLRGNPNYVRARGILDDVESFDANFFGLSSLEAEVMDPQQRIMLELAWEALEHSGHSPETFDGLIGVFAGMGNNTYYFSNLLSRPDVLRSVGEMQAMVANEKDYLATRVSYLLNLKGPSLSVNTACSTSLVAVCSAYDSLLNYQCDMALAGGITVRVPQNVGYLWQEVMIFSKDGHCRPFDAAASGTVASNGGGLVLLKRLEDAIADNDTVYAVIRGTGVNNDGSGKMSFMAPSVDGQARAIAMALSAAGFEPSDISYIEAHGTGTAIGDPIEIAALTKVFGNKRGSERFCAIGSAKSNVGHLDAGAGVAGLMKATLALYHGKLPPTVHFNQPNPEIDFDNSPFYVNDRLTDWPRGAKPRRAGVSSFGVGGTNAHVVVEQGPERSRAEAESVGPQVVLLSAKTASSLERATKDLSRNIQKNLDTRLQDISYTLAVGRRAHQHRRAVVCGTAADVCEELSRAGESRSVRTAVVAREQWQVAFMFPGQGAQYVNMGVALYEQESVYRDTVDRCAEFLRPIIQVDIRALLYPQAETVGRASAQLQQTRFNQPAVFAVEYALAKLWESWGVKPSAMIGHSLGEYVAACIAGVFSLEDGLALVADRGRLMQSVPEGAMLIVRMPVEDLQRRLLDGLSISAINSPELCVVSGPSQPVRDIQQELESERVPCRRLHTSHAFHSEMMEPVLEPFRECVRNITLSPPEIPFVSTATGDWITPREATDPDYWTSHIRNTVQFSKGIATLLEDRRLLLLEVGPGSTTTHLTRDHLDAVDRHRAFASLGNATDRSAERTEVLKAAGELWLAGIPIDWSRLYGFRCARRVPLPTYPFERTRHWVEPSDSARRLEIVSNTRLRSQDTESNPESANANDTEAEIIPHPSTKRVSTPTEEMLCHIWKRVLPGVDEVGVEEDFFELGGHSLLAVPLFAEILRESGVDLPLSTLFEAPTIRRMATALDGAKPDNSVDLNGPEVRPVGTSSTGRPHRPHPRRDMWDSLVCLQSGGDLVPFFCIHAIGGNVVNYSRVLPFLDPDQPFYGLQARGLDGVSRPPRSIEAMAANYIAEIREVQPHGPYLLGGGSMGGLVAFEMARKLIEAGENVGLLVMFDTQGPNPLTLEKGRDVVEPRFQLHARYSKLRSRLLQDGEPGRSFASLLLRKTLNRVATSLRYLKCEASLLIGMAISHDDRYWYIQQRHSAIMNRYAPGHYDGRIVMLRAVPRVDGKAYDREHGWTGMASEGIKVIEVPGDHFAFVEEPEVGRRLGECIAEAQELVRGAPKADPRCS